VSTAAASDGEGWRREIQELHRFFEGWLGGDLPEGDEAFRRVALALHPALTFVSPSGRSLDRATLLGGLRDAHGSRPGLRIQVEALRIHLETERCVVATYLERQRQGTDETLRRSTVVFVPDAEAPRGLAWRHVHETWVDGSHLTTGR